MSLNKISFVDEIKSQRFYFSLVNESIAHDHMTFAESNCFDGIACMFILVLLSQMSLINVHIIEIACE